MQIEAIIISVKITLLSSMLNTVCLSNSITIELIAMISMIKKYVKMKPSSLSMKVCSMIMQSEAYKAITRVNINFLDKHD